MKNYLIVTAILFLTFQSYSQGLRVNSELPVNIDANGSSPHQSAMLDVKSTSKGVLIPRMTTSQRNAISSPAIGLLVFDTNTKGFWFYNGSVWTDLSSSSGLSELPSNPQPGEMVYYDGTDWVSILPGTTGQKLCYCDGVPTWGPCPETCSDGIMNQNETGIDCGGVCTPCPTSCNCPFPVIDDRLCVSGMHPHWRFAVDGANGSDVITWSVDFGTILAGQGEDYVIIEIGPDTAGGFTVFCEVSTWCGPGVGTKSRTAYYSNFYNGQCGSGTSGISEQSENCVPLPSVNE